MVAGWSTSQLLVWKITTSLMNASIDFSMKMANKSLNLPHTVRMTERGVAYRVVSRVLSPHI